MLRRKAHADDRRVLQIQFDELYQNRSSFDVLVIVHRPARHVARQSGIHGINVPVDLQRAITGSEAQIRRPNCSKEISCGGFCCVISNAADGPFKVLPGDINSGNFAKYNLAILLIV